MIIVTGGAGFIGSNLIKALNQRGKNQILVVDDLTDGTKFSNLVDLDILDYIDKDDFLKDIKKNKIFTDKIEAVFHQGACSSTTEWDGKMMMNNNYHYSKELVNYCINQQINFIYASSAAVYGNSTTFKEEALFEKPLNVYGYSKLLFDQYIRRLLQNKSIQMVGLRYFNVYGPRENHKASMASVAFHLYHQLKNQGRLKLFEGCEGYQDGEQRRDFVYVEDVASVNLWFMDNPQHSGIFNIGTGRSQPFNDVAHSLIEWSKKGEIEYIPFPDHLKGRYQSFTEADITLLREVGFNQSFKTVQEGMNDYLNYLVNH